MGEGHKRDIFCPQVLTVYLRQQTEHMNKRQNVVKYCEARVMKGEYCTCWRPRWERRDRASSRREME